MVSALTAVLRAIARAVLGDADDAPVELGTVTLHAHQRNALRRLRASVASVGGALLADEPGLGKTFVALALAREFPATIVVAPAALRAMWRDAALAAGVRVAFVSMETLSRREFEDHASAGLVIVDEAHHACNPATVRYARLARLATYRKVLLLSATPVRNRREELAALLALFMGQRAYALDDAAHARCIIRRSGDASLCPGIDGPHWHRVRSTPRVREMIANLPPPLPALDGREASALLCMTLARCWASSLAALDAALKRRLQRGAALGAILAAGRVPTRHELRAWVLGDDAVQLAFPMFASHETPDAARLRVVLDGHLGAVHALRTLIRSRVSGDANTRAQLLLELRRTHAGARIVAFTAHAATAEVLYRALARERGVALLTARGARTAGGSRPRADVIDALGASSLRSARDAISLVITTDLLSEGVNLQGASVVVHLDLPWTPAGLDQRVGRAARMGSQHATVHVHGIAPPAAAERLLAMQRRLTRKHAEQTAASRAPQAAAQLRELVRSWLSDESSDDVLEEGRNRESRNSVRVEGRPPGQNAECAELDTPGSTVGFVRASRSGFIAVVEYRAGPAVVGGILHAGGRWRISDAPTDLCQMVLAVVSHGAVRAAPALPNAKHESSARAALDRWLDGHRVRESIGAVVAPSSARRNLLTQIDFAVRRTAVHLRAARANRIAHIRALVDQAISAGAERALDELAHNAASDLESLLAACETRLAGGGGCVEPSAGAAPAGKAAVRALLLLRRPD